MTQGPHRAARRSTPPHPAPRLTTLVALAGLAAMSNSIFLPSLPYIATWYDASYAVISLSITLYLVISSFLQIVFGTLSDMFGRRPVAIACVLLFVVGSIGAMLSPVVEAFLAFRMLQAAIVGAMVVSRAVARDVSDDAQAAAYLSYLTMCISLVPLAAPVIGGVVQESVGWQGSFLLTGCLALIVLLLVWVDFRETAVRDGAGIRSRVQGYGVLLRSTSFWGNVAFAVTGSAAYFSLLGAGPLIGIRFFSLSPSQLGVYMAIPAAGYVIGNYISGRFSSRFGVGTMMGIGAVIVVAGTALPLLLVFAGLMTPAIFFGCLGISIVGNGMALPGANIRMMSIRPDLVGSASGLSGALIVGGGAAIAAAAGWLSEGAQSLAPLTAVMLASSCIALALAALLVTRKFTWQ